MVRGEGGREERGEVEIKKRNEAREVDFVSWKPNVSAAWQNLLVKNKRIKSHVIQLLKQLQQQVSSHLHITEIPGFVHL